MSRGSVYQWLPSCTGPVGGELRREVVDLPGLQPFGSGPSFLSSRFVQVMNRGFLPGSAGDAQQAEPIGNAQPDQNGDFLFEGGIGGGRLDLHPVADREMRRRYVEAAHFGEVNSYDHLQRIASYIESLLQDLGETSIPGVIAVVNAHDAIRRFQGYCDGVMRSGRIVAFQGGHYRRPSSRYEPLEFSEIREDGEIHLGPGRQLVDSGALFEVADRRYRANASHNAGILYHEYGHHIHSHIADFRLNNLRPSNDRDNRKPAIDEGTCDYWAATMLQCPHIWICHKRHDETTIHPRSLASPKTMDDYVLSGDPHSNGTIWGAALWDLRCKLASSDIEGSRQADLLILKMLILIGASVDHASTRRRSQRNLRASFSHGLSQLIKAAELLYGGSHIPVILTCFAKRKIVPATLADLVHRSPTFSHRVDRSEIPSSEDLLTPEDLEAFIVRQSDTTWSLVAVGDVMLGERMKTVIATHGRDCPFQAVLPILRRSQIVLGNLEGPFGGRSITRENRNHSYKVNPELAYALKEANFSVLTLANNHLMDCGHKGVLKTFDALERAGLKRIGAGINAADAHRPAICVAGGYRIGLLGYYWNRRCAATPNLPGSATDTESELRADIEQLKTTVDRIVITFHWGIPYEREPAVDVRQKARFAVDCGADVVIGHHPHIIQPFEIYREAPIFYSIGNFTFGSGNSRAEGLVLALRFLPLSTTVEIFPVYLKNRDPRINYRPRIMSGAASRRILTELGAMSAPYSNELRIAEVGGSLCVRRSNPKPASSALAAWTGD